MTGAPSRCVVDTNVAVTANATPTATSAGCIAASGRALATVTQGGHLFIDEGGAIVAEYRANLNARGEPGPGDLFLKWVMTHEYGRKRVTRVPITVEADTADGFLELPAPPAGIRYDPSDRKFLAVAAAHPDKPPVLQALDSKWWGWQDALAAIGVTTHFLCPAEIAAKHAEKL